MAIEVTCSCGKKLHAKEEHAGKRAKCPACGEVLTLPGNPTSAFDVFVSHCKDDKTTADAICATLEARGIRCWIAPRDIVAGMEWGESIIEGINQCRMMILVYSSKANQSPQVRREIERAVAKGLILIPFRIEDVPLSKSMEYFLSSPHWLDALTPPLEAHLQKVAEAAVRLLGLEGRRPPAPLAPSAPSAPVVPIAPSAPPPPSKPSGFQASQMLKEAEVFRTLGQHAQAVPLYRQALEMFEPLDDKAGAALCANNMAFSMQPDHDPAGNWEQARAAYRKALAWREALDDKPNQVPILGNIAFCLRPDINPGGNWKEAGEAYRRQAEVAGEVGDKRARAKALFDAASCAEPARNPQGNWDESGALYGQAAQLYEELQDGLNQGIALHNQAFDQIRGIEANVTEESRELFRRAAAASRAAGAVGNAENSENFVNFRASAAEQIFTQATAIFNAGQWAQAAPLLARAAEVFASEGNLPRLALCLHNQAFALEPSRNPAGSWTTVVELYRKAADLRASSGNSGLQADSLGNLGCALFPSSNPAGNWAEARKALHQAVELKRIAGDKTGEGTFLTHLARAYQRNNDPAGSWEKAVEYSKAALALRVEAKDAANQAINLGDLGICFLPTINPTGDWAQAAAYFRQTADLYVTLGDIKTAGDSFHLAAFSLIKGDGKNMTEQAWETFRLAGQYRRQAGDAEGAKQSEAWLH